MPFLYLITPSGAAMERWKLGKNPVTFGRGEQATARVEDDCLSREHFLIACEERGFILRDLGSKNGTWLNGSNVRCEPLPVGARIHAGRSVFIFEPGLQTALDDLPAARAFFHHLDGALNANGGGDNAR